MLKSSDKSAKGESGVLSGGLEARLSREWLLTNGRGGFAMGTVCGCPTRRYHGYLVAARRPPLERMNMLAGVAETLNATGASYSLWTVAQRDGMLGDGIAHLIEFDSDPGAESPWALWRYRTPVADVTKRLVLHRDKEIATIEYTISGTQESPIGIELRPLVVMRDFHALREGDGWPDWDCSYADGCLHLADRSDSGVNLAITATALSDDADIRFDHMPQAVDGVRYSIERERGFEDTETLVSEGAFIATGKRRFSVTLAVGAFFESADAATRELARASKPIAVAHRTKLSPTARLKAAADQFIAHRASPEHEGSATILAGYPWFGDWGRDAFISLEGLLLCTGRFDEARQVLETFAGAQRNGLIPNLFDDYGRDCHYNSVDASLWYIHAADRYLARSGDKKAWKSFLATACRNVIEAFITGTDFDIALCDDGLIQCGHEDVQITWMDAKCGDVVFTPRHGKPVEVNALWYRALCIGARRFAATNKTLQARCEELADLCRDGFAEAFIRPDGQGLYDVVRDDFKDAAVRPNQVFAASLEDSPLDDDAAKSVVRCAAKHLLTPVGLRSLAPNDPAYQGRFGGTPFERDSAYHQGTVWSWLIGPYVEAYLRVHDFADDARRHCRQLLSPLIAHLDEACLSSVSEVFEGDPPHAPRGCVAQAWSVAELIRSLELLES